MNKQEHQKKVQNGFNKAAKSYDRFCSIQNKICADLIRVLKPHLESPETVVDLACGTGESTLALHAAFDCKKIYGVDLCLDLLDVARTKAEPSRTHFIQSSFDGYAIPKTTDLVFCNMGLQWSFDLGASLKHIESLLPEKSLLAFSMPLHGTFCELKIKCRNTFLMADEVKYMLKQNNYKTLNHERLNYKEIFADSWQAIKSIKGVGANIKLNEGNDMVSTAHPSKGLSKIKSNYLFEFTDCNQLSYYIGFFVAQKRCL